MENKTPRIVHCKKSPYDIYIGRPSRWGNPYKIGPDGDRDTVIEKYKGDYRRLPLGTALFTNLVDNPVSRQEIDYARSHYYGVEEM